MSKKKAFFSFEEDLNHHKEFVRHFEKRIEPLINNSYEITSFIEYLTIFENMYEWITKHLQKFEDSAFELATELLSEFCLKDKEHLYKDQVSTEITELLFLQTFVKVHNCFETNAKQEQFQNSLMYLLAKKLLKFEVNNKQELVFALFALMISQDLLKKTTSFFPEIIICLERVLLFFQVQLDQENIHIDKKSLDINDKTFKREDILAVFQLAFREKQNITTASFFAITYKILEKLMNSYFILFGNDTNSDITLSHLQKIFDGLTNPLPLNYSENILRKLKNLIEYTRVKSELNIIKDKPLIRIKQLTPKFGDSDEDLDENYDEELRKERRTLKKAVSKETKKAMKELTYDSMILQTQKDLDKEKLKDRKKSSFKKFAKFMEEQQLEGKRIKTTQLQHKARNKVKKRRLAGNKTDPNSEKN